MGDISNASKSNCLSHVKLSLGDICVFVIYFSDRVITVLRLKPKANNDKCVLIGTLKYIDAFFIEKSSRMPKR